jgi:uncharacterized membrane protein
VRRDVARLAALFTVSGAMHFLRPEPYERIVPHALPRRRELVYVTGALELACAAGLAIPRTRRLAGLASTGLLLAIWPANVQMAADLVQSRASAPVKAAALARLPLQWPMIRTAWRASRTPR